MAVRTTYDISSNGLLSIHADIAIKGIVVFTVQGRQPAVSNTSQAHLSMSRGLYLVRVAYEEGLPRMVKVAR